MIGHRRPFTVIDAARILARHRVVGRRAGRGVYPSAIPRDMKFGLVPRLRPLPTTADRTLTPEVAGSSPVAPVSQCRIEPSFSAWRVVSSVTELGTRTPQPHRRRATWEPRDSRVARPDRDLTRPGRPSSHADSGTTSDSASRGVTTRPTHPPPSSSSPRGLVAGGYPHASRSGDVGGLVPLGGRCERLPRHRAHAGAMGVAHPLMMIRRAWFPAGYPIERKIGLGPGRRREARLRAGALPRG